MFSKVVLNCKEIKKDLQIITKIIPFINKLKWDEVNFPLEKHNWKIFEKNNRTIALNALYAIIEKYILLMFQNITQIVKSKSLF